jgi:hypothetical protein
VPNGIPRLWAKCQGAGRDPMVSSAPRRVPKNLLRRTIARGQFHGCATNSLLSPSTFTKIDQNGKPSRKGNDRVDAEATFELRWEGTQTGFQMMIMMIPPTSNARRGTAAPSAIAAWHSQSHCCQHFMAPMDHDDCQRERSETSRKWGLAKT